jgi:hypothetical protein
MKHIRARSTLCGCSRTWRGQPQPDEQCCTWRDTLVGKHPSVCIRNCIKTHVHENMRAERYERSVLHMQVFVWAPRPI